MRKANREDKKIIVDILISAFGSLDEPNSINLVVKQDDKRLDRMKILMSYLFERAILFGEIFLSVEDKACLLVEFSDRERFSLKILMLKLKLVFYAIGITSISKVLKRQRLANRIYPKENHIRPLILGTKHEAVGSGNAARLMINVKNQFKSNALPVIVDAASLKNVKLYEKLGFRIIRKDDSLGFTLYFLRIN